MAEEPLTEARSSYVDLDTLSIREVLNVIHAEDRRAVAAVGTQLDRIEAAVQRIVAAFQQGGRLYYVGAGTSGRLGVLDVSECPPTFGTPPDMVQGVIAGGPDALVSAAEGAEDDAEQGARDVAERGVAAADVVVGIAASGRTPYVLGALAEAGRRGAGRIALVCSPNSPVSQAADIAIEPATGPEVLAGSTRMKAGTAQKLVLNMLSTVSMIQIGKVYSNLMVDVQPTNRKLRQRALRIVRVATGCDESVAKSALEAADWHAKVAIVMVETGCERKSAERYLAHANGFVRGALDLARGKP